MVTFPIELAFYIGITLRPLKASNKISLLIRILLETADCYYFVNLICFIGNHGVH